MTRSINIAANETTSFGVSVALYIVLERRSLKTYCESYRNLHCSL